MSSKNVTNDFDNRIEFIIGILNEKLRRQGEAHAALVTKASYIGAFLSIILAGYLATVFDEKIDFNCSILFSTSRIIILLGLLLSFLSLTIASRNRKNYDPPTTGTIYSDQAFKLQVDDLKNVVASDMKSAYDKNVKPVQDFAKWLDRTSLLFFVTVTLIIASAIFVPKCAIIQTMDDNNNTNNTQEQQVQQEHNPVKPSETPGTPIYKGPVPSSSTPGTVLPFGEESNFLNFNKEHKF